jgi:predicted site-specific integrase-resolvase
MTRPRKPPQPTVLLTAAETAGRFRVARNTVYVWARSGILTPVCLPGTGTRPARILFDEAEVEQHISNSRQPAAGHPARTTRGAA